MDKQMEDANESCRQTTLGSTLDTSLNNLKEKQYISYKFGNKIYMRLNTTVPNSQEDLVYYCINGFNVEQSRYILQLESSDSHEIIISSPPSSSLNENYSNKQVFSQDQSMEEVGYMSPQEKSKQLCLRTSVYCEEIDGEESEQGVLLLKKNDCIMAKLALKIDTFIKEYWDKCWKDTFEGDDNLYYEFTQIIIEQSEKYIDSILKCSNDIELQSFITCSTSQN